MRNLVKLPLLQAEQTVSLSIFSGFVLQPSLHIGGLPPALLQYISICLVLGSQKCDLDTVSHQIKGTAEFPQCLWCSPGCSCLISVIWVYNCSFCCSQGSPKSFSAKLPNLFCYVPGLNWSSAELCFYYCWTLKFLSRYLRMPLQIWCSKVSQDTFCPIVQLLEMLNSSVLSPEECFNPVVGQLTSILQAQQSTIFHPHCGQFLMRLTWSDWDVDCQMALDAMLYIYGCLHLIKNMGHFHINSLILENKNQLTHYFYTVFYYILI